MRMICIFFLFLTKLAYSSYETDTVKIRGNQNISGNKTFTGNINLQALTGNCVLRSDGSDNLTCGGFDIDNSGNLTGVDGIFSGSVNSNLILEMVSTTKASKPCPEMTTVQRDALTPVTGSCIYNSTTLSYQFYNGTSWGDVGGGASTTQVNSLLFWFSAASNNGQNCFAVTPQRIEYEDEIADPDNLYDPATGTFTVPTVPSGTWCLFNASAFTPSYSGAAGDAYELELYRAGTLIRMLSRRELDDPNTGSNSDTIGGSAMIPVGTGNTFDIRGTAPATIACGGSQTYNYFSAFCYRPL